MLKQLPLSTAGFQEYLIVVQKYFKFISVSVLSLGVEVKTRRKPFYFRGGTN